MGGGQAKMIERGQISKVCNVRFQTADIAVRSGGGGCGDGAELPSNRHFVRRRRPSRHAVCAHHIFHDMSAVSLARRAAFISHRQHRKNAVHVTILVIHGQNNLTLSLARKDGKKCHSKDMGPIILTALTHSLQCSFDAESFDALVMEPFRQRLHDNMTRGGCKFET
jgi:hypothetical protein